MIKKINVMYDKETIWSSHINEIQENNEIQKNKDISLEELLKIVPNKEEKKKLLEELHNATKKEKEEIENFYKTEVKPVFKELKENLFNSEYYKKAKEKIKELEDKIKELRNKKEKSPEDYEKSRVIKTQLVFLKQSSKY